MDKFTRICLISLVALCPVRAYSLSLGQLNVYSAAGEPLRAEIEILKPNPKLDVNSLRASLASQPLFQRFGLRLSPALRQLNLSSTVKNGRPIIVISTNSPLNVNELKFLIQVEGSGESTLKKYSLRLPRPARMASASRATTPPPKLVRSPKSTEAMPAAATGTSPVIRPMPVNARPSAADNLQTDGERDYSRYYADPNNSNANTRKATRKTTRKTTQKKIVHKKPVPRRVSTRQKATSSPKTQHTVRRGDTLYRIAARNRHTGVTTAQMLLAIYEKNRSFFANRNPSQLNVGDRLKLPSRQEARGITLSAAKQFDQRLKRGLAPEPDNTAPAATRMATTQTPPRHSSNAPTAHKVVQQAAQTPTASPQQSQQPDGIAGPKGQMAASADPTLLATIDAKLQRMQHLEIQMQNLQRLLEQKDAEQQRVQQLLRQKNRLLLRQEASVPGHKANPSTPSPSATGTQPVTPAQSVTKPATATTAVAMIAPTTRASLQAAMPATTATVTPPPTTTPDPAAPPSAANSSTGEASGLSLTSSPWVNRASLLTARVETVIRDYPLQLFLLAWMLLLSRMVLKNRQPATRQQHSTSDNRSQPQHTPAHAAMVNAPATHPKVVRPAYPEHIQYMDHPRGQTVKTEADHWQQHRHQLQASIDQLHSNLLQLEELSSALKATQKALARPANF